MVMKTSKTLKIEVVDDQADRIVFKLQQEYTPKVVAFSKAVDSLVTLTLGEWTFLLLGAWKMFCLCSLQTNIKR